MSGGASPDGDRAFAASAVEPVPVSPVPASIPCADLVMTGATADEIWPLVRDHHYSRAMPAGVSHAFAWRQSGGLFGDTGEPLAGVLFGNPSGRNWPGGSLELSRLVRHPMLTAPLSSLVSWSLRWLRAHTDFAFCLSYADEGQGHHGGIYQAAGFTYVAYRPSKHFEFFDEGGNRIHARTFNQRLGTSNAKAVAELDPTISVAPAAPKFLYIKPLRQKLKPLLRRFGWEPLPFPKPDFAARLLDEHGSPVSEPGANPGGRSTHDRKAA